jgi:hypothetical protein
VHPTAGNDTLYLGTSPLQPFKTVRKVLESTAVQTAASLGGGTNVIVRIIDDGTENVSITNINSLTLTAGSVTVLPDSGVNFTLNLNTKLLTLNKGYRLQGFKIVSGDPDGTGAAITLNAAGTPLKDMLIDCKDLGSAGTGTDVGGLGDRCIEVTASSATVTLDNVDVWIKGDQNFTAGIHHKGANTILRVINGSSVVATGPATGSQGVVGILENSNGGSVEIEGPNTEVNLSAISPPTSGTPKPNVAILLKGNSGPLRKVINSQIKVKEPTLPATQGQIGVCVGSTINVTVQGSTFTNSPLGNNSIAICQQAAGSVSPDPLSSGNSFIDFGLSREFVTSSCSCPS